MKVNNKFKNKGFTLMELLAIIIIIAVIALISVPIVSNILVDSKRETFKTNVKLAIDAMDEYLIDNGYKKYKKNGITVFELNNYTPNNFKNGRFQDKDGMVEAHMVTDGIYCAKGTYKDLKISKKCSDLDDTGADFDESKLYITSNTKSIKVVIAEGFAQDTESGIKEYSVTVFGKGTQRSDGVGVFQFDNLKHNTDYKVIIGVTNGNGITETLERTITTTEITEPEIIITNETAWKPSKTVKFTGDISGTELQYKIVNGTTLVKDWTTITNGGTYKIDYTSNVEKPTYIYARITDGTNTVDAVTKTQTMIDPEPPTIMANGAATGETSTITIPIRVADTGGSGIKKVTCEYGTSTNYGTYGDSTGGGANNVIVNQASCKITKLTKNTKYYYRVTATDYADNPTTASDNNKEVVGNTQTENITAPTIVVSNETTWKKEKIVTFQGSAKGAELQYKVVNGTTLMEDWTTVENGGTYLINYTSNTEKPTYIYARITDGTNTVDAITKTQTKVDADPPMIESNGSVTTETSTITIPIKTSDIGGSGVGIVKCEYGTNANYGKSATSDGAGETNISVSKTQCKITKLTKNTQYYYRITVKDIAGNNSTSSQNKKEVVGTATTADMDTPICTIDNETVWKPSKVVTCSGTAKGAYLQYRIRNGSTWKVGESDSWVTIASGHKYTIDYTSNLEKQTDIYVRLTDGTNTMAPATKTQTMIDAEPPTIETNGVASTSTSTINIPIKVADTGGSGFDHITCEYGTTTDYGRTANTEKNANGCKITKLNKNTKYYYRVRVVDVAGNNSKDGSTKKEVTNSATTEDIPVPIIEIANETTWKPSKVVTFKGTATGAHLEYRIINGEDTIVNWTEVNNGGSYTIDYTSNLNKPTYIYLRMTDGTNTVDATTKTQTMIDAEKPKIKANGSVSMTTSTATIPYTVSDTGGSGINNIKCRYKANGTSTWSTANVTTSQTQCKITKLKNDKTYDYNVWVEDNAGNSSKNGSSNKEISGSFSPDTIPEPTIKIMDKNGNLYDSSNVLIETKPMKEKKVGFYGTANGAHLEYKLVTAYGNHTTLVDWTEVNNGGTYTLDKNTLKVGTTLVGATVEEPLYIYLRMTDGTNTVDASTKTQTAVDIKPPTVASRGTVSTTTSTATIPITATDTGGSGIKAVSCEYGETNSYGNTSNVTTSATECKITKLKHHKMYYYRIRVTDNAGNSSTEATSNSEVVGTFSTEQMCTPTISIANETTWKPSKVVTFTGTAGGAHLEYRIINGTTTKVDWSQASNGYKYTIDYTSNTEKPTYIYARCTDGTNTVDATTKTQTMVDPESPQIVENGSASSTTSSITIPFTPSDTGGSGVGTVHCEYGETTSYGKTSNATVNADKTQCKITKLAKNKAFYYHIWVEDNAGNSSINSKNNKEIKGSFSTENIPVPTIEIANEATWKPSKIVTFKGIANGAHLEYKLVTAYGNHTTLVDWEEINNGGTVTLDESKLKVDSTLIGATIDNPLYIYLRLTDGTNTVDASTKTQTMIDVIHPTIEENGTISTTTSTATIPITTADTGGSGVGDVICKYKKNGDSSWVTSNVTTSSSQCKITKLLKNSSYNYEISVKDKAGNSSTNCKPSGCGKKLTGTFSTVDIPEPTIKITNMNGNEYENSTLVENIWKPKKKVVFTGVAPSAHLEYKIVNGTTTKVNWTEINNGGSYTIDYNSNVTTPTHIYLRLTDGTNTVDATTKTQTMVDTENPAIVTRGSLTKGTSTITIPFTASDTGGSGVGTVHCEYKLSTESTWKTTNTKVNVEKTSCTISKLTHNKNYDYHLWVEDNAGNSSLNASSNKEIKGDTDTPEMCTPTISIANETKWKPSKVVTFTGSATGAELQYKIINGTTTKVDWNTVGSGTTYTINYTSNVDTPTYIYARCTDGTNTVDATTKTQTMVDPVPPTIVRTPNTDVTVTTSTINIPITTADTGGSLLGSLQCEYGETTSYGNTANVEHNPTMTYCKISKLKHGTKYYYRIRVKDGAGNSSTSGTSNREVTGNISTVGMNEPPTITVENESVWKSSKKVTFTGTVPSGSKLQYKLMLGTTTKVDWTDVSNGANITLDSTLLPNGANSTNPLYIYARFYDGTNTKDAQSKTQTMIDVVPPEIVTRGTATSTTSTITIPVTTTDTGGSDFKKLHCRYKESNSSSWLTTNVSTTQLQCKISKLTSNATYDYEVWVEDNAGNLSTSSKTNKKVTGSIDAKQMCTPTISIANETTWKPSKVVTFTGSAAGAELQYKVINGTTTKVNWTTVSSGGTYTIDYASNIDTPAYIYARCTDGTNTKDATTKTQTMVDPEPPCVAVNGTMPDPESSVITIPLTMSDSGGSKIKDIICEYKATTASNWTTSNTTTSETQCRITKLTQGTAYDYQVTVKDNAGNVSTSNSSNSCKKVSGTKTTLTITEPSVSFPNNDETTMKKSKTVKFTGQAPGAELQYKLVTGYNNTTLVDWKTISNNGTVTLDKDNLKVGSTLVGATTNYPLYIYVRLTDGTNTVSPASKTQTAIDVISPTVVSNGSPTGQTSTVTIPISVADTGGSGVNTVSCEYKESTSSTWLTTNVTVSQTQCKITKLTSSKTYDYRIRVKDGVGNYSSYLNGQAGSAQMCTPVISFNPTSDETKWKPSKVVKFTGSASGAHIEYKIVSGTTTKVDWTTVANNGEITLNKDILPSGATIDIPAYIYARCTDGTNVVNGTTKTQTMIDVIPPTISSNGNASEGPSSVTIPFTASDTGGSGVGSVICEYGTGSTYNKSSANGVSNIIVSSTACTIKNLMPGETYNYRITVKDGAGNLSTQCTATGCGKQITGSFESDSPPVPTYSVNPNSGWAFEKTVTIDYHDAGGNFTHQFSLDGGATWSTYSSPIKFTQNGSIIARNIDPGYNLNYVEGSVLNIINIYAGRATDVSYDNSSSGLDCADVQCAIDEIYDMVDD